MKKKISFMLSFFLMIVLCSSAVYALDSSKVNDILIEVEKTNQLIQGKIEKSVVEAQDEINKCEEMIEKLQEERLVADEEELDEINNKILECETKLSFRLDEIINTLIEETNQLANDMVEKAAEEGITVICELIEVEIGGRNVLIDPLKVINL